MTLFSFRFLFFFLILHAGFGLTTRALQAAGSVDSAPAERLPKNFAKVSSVLYRGAQPSEEEFQTLKNKGIKTVVNLRSFHSDRRETEKIGLAYQHIYMKAWHPETEDVVRFLKIVTEESAQPVFVHCQHGADRTGMMVAAYRLAVCGWSKEKAVEEMLSERFGFHEIWDNLISHLNGLDVEKLRQEAGISGKTFSCD